VNALGLTTAEAAAPAPLLFLPANGFAIVAADDQVSATAQERLRLQVLGAGTLPSFLPLPVRERIDPEAARALLRDRGAAVGRSLARVAGRVQVMVDASEARGAGAAAPAASGGGGWLPLRAAHAARCAAAAAGLRAILAQLGDVRVIRRGGCLQAAALAPGGADEAALSELAGTLAACTDLSGWRLSVTGPWPAYAFCDLADPTP
jgi:hypothetical protein